MLLAIFTILLFSNLAISGKIGPLFPSAPVKTYNLHVPKLGAVTSIVSQCSRIGIDILKCGGNAADAVSYLVQVSFWCHTVEIFLIVMYLCR